MRGFIALMSAVILSAVLLVVVLAASYSGFVARFAVLDAEYKERSSALVDACADIILLRLGNDSSYVGPETVTVSGSTCQILGVIQQGTNPEVFKLQAEFQNAYTNALVGVDTNTISISSWQEIGHF
jgi:hypothetical protein